MEYFIICVSPIFKTTLDSCSNFQMTYTDTDIVHVGLVISGF